MEGPDRPAGVRERRCVGAGALVDALAAELHRQLEAALRERGVASLVVSGGRTPIPLFRRLRTLPLDWHRVDITLADERWVDPADPASNEGLVRRELLQDLAAAARFTGLKTPAATPQLGVREAWARLAPIARPFDVVVLGMGDDGHFASLFPGSPGIAAALDRAAPPACVAMSSPVAPNARISLNLAALAQARRTCLHIEGAHKWQVYRAAARRAAAGEGGPPDPPVLATLRPPLPGLQVWWAP